MAHAGNSVRLSERTRSSYSFQTSPPTSVARFPRASVRNPAQGPSSLRESIRGAAAVRATLRQHGSACWKCTSSSCFANCWVSPAAACISPVCLLLPDQRANLVSFLCATFSTMLFTALAIAKQTLSGVCVVLPESCIFTVHRDVHSRTGHVWKSEASDAPGNR